MRSLADREKESWLIASSFLRPPSEQLKKRDGEVQRRIAVLIGKIETLPDPRSIGEALHGDKQGSFWKYRVGDWRIVASIKDAVLTVVVIEIDRRSTIYR